MNLREAALLALYALELEDMACRHEKEQTPEQIARAIAALHAALAEPEQRPVKSYAGGKPNYVQRTEELVYRKPLTDEQIDAITVKQWGRDFMVPAAGRAWARAIEAAHGIKQEEA